MCKQPICKCGFDSCLNDGRFDATNCACVCSKEFTGSRCETLLNTTVPKLNDCTQSLVCQNGARLNPNTCKCECRHQFTLFYLNFVVNFFNLFIGYPSYTGTLCESVLCQNQDPKICEDFSLNECLKLAIVYYCPQLCGICKGSASTSSSTTKLTMTTATTSTTTTITTTTTKTISNCAQKCLNGGKQNPNNCSCECKELFNGYFEIVNKKYIILKKAILHIQEFFVKQYYVKMSHLYAKIITALKIAASV